MASITRFITTKLKLKVNGQKSAVARPCERTFLGFSFTNAGVPKRRIAPKAVDRFKGRIRELTQRTRGVSMERMAGEVAQYLRRWIAYFGKVRNAFGAAGPGRVDQTQTTLCALEAVEEEPGPVR